MMYRKFIQYNVLLICSLILLGVALPAQAQSEMGCTNGRYADWLAIGETSTLILECNIATSNDQLIIVPTATALDASLPWQENINDQEAFWLFDIGSTGEINLVIDFHFEEGVLTASLFDDQDGDGAVRFDVENGRILIRESAYWSMRVQAADGWWQRDGLVNHNLDIQVDGAIKAAFGSEIYQDQMENDGWIDFKIEVRDANGNGRPETELIQATPPISESSGILRTLIMVNPEDDEQLPNSSFIWPYLNDGTDGDIVKGYNAGLTPIQMNWTEGKIVGLAEFVASRGNEGNWFTYSIDRLLNDDAEQSANFEAPFAFYDLANDNDGVPELQIRFEHYPPDDVYMSNAAKRPLAYSNQNVRYSWDQDNDGAWDYKIDTIGRYDATHSIDVGPLQYLSFDIANLPVAITHSPWDAITFVAAERTYLSTEGIYEWAAAEIRELWVSGQADTVPEAFQTLPVGLRGDYLLESVDAPRLYVSPIDSKLHLLNAAGGLWQVTNRDTILYKNVNGDAYLDQWQLVRDGAVLQQVNTVETYLLFFEEDTLSIYPFTESTPATMAPPDSTEAWQALDRALTAVSPAPTPTTLTTLVDQFESDPLLTITGVQLQQIRPYAQGFQFVASTDSTFTAEGDLFWNQEAPTRGTHLFTFDGQWRITPHETAWQLTAQAPSEAIYAQETVPVQLTVDLFQDLVAEESYWLVGEEVQGNTTVEILRQPVSQPMSQVFNWQASTNTAVTLHFYIENEAGDRLTSFDLPISFSADNRERPLSLLANNTTLYLGSALLLIIAALFATASKLALKHPTKEVA